MALSPVVHLLTTTPTRATGRERLHPPFEKPDQPQVPEEVCAEQGADLDFPSHGLAA